MNSQIFKNQVPKEQLLDLLEKICCKTENYYIFNKIAYKKAEFMGILQPFVETLIPYYHVSKKFYLTRKQTYCYFATIIRHICKSNEIKYVSNIVYTKSTYDIVYHISFTPLNI